MSRTVMWIGATPPAGWDSRLSELDWSVTGWIHGAYTRSEMLAMVRSNMPSAVVVDSWSPVKNPIERPYDLNNMRDSGIGVVFLVRGTADQIGPFVRDENLANSADILALECPLVEPHIRRFTLTPVVPYPQTADDLTFALARAVAARAKVRACCRQPDRLR